MRITRVEATELFTGTTGRPLQIVRVTLTGDGAADGAGGAAAAGAGTPAAVRIEGPAVRTPRPAMTPSPEPGQEQTAQVGGELPAPPPAGANPRAPRHPD